ncbi:hypothetical protein [Streptomyces sp. NPDC088746]|uniref:hypothetical protein n=1 Tax=Streptomyces sp. NPDC088746 TaxID=3365885 RepID=UPI00381C58F5
MAECVARATAVRDVLGLAWQSLLEGHTEDELEVIARYMPQAHNLNHTQMRSLPSPTEPD